MIFTDKKLVYLNYHHAIDYTVDGVIPYPQILATSYVGETILFEITKDIYLCPPPLFISVLPGSILRLTGEMLKLEAEYPRVRFSKCRFPTKDELEFYERFSLL